MDSFTHTLTGVVVAKAIGDKKLGSWGTVAGLTMGFFPDTDFVLGLFDRQFYIQYHRDFTHSLLLIPFYALFFSWLFVKVSKRPHFWNFYRVCLPVLVSHVLGDLLTSYGTMIFSPFWGNRVSWDLVFIIDLIFSGILFFPWIVSLFWKRKARWVCRGSLIGLILYVLFCWSQQSQAIQLSKTFAQSLGEEVLQVASLPQPLSPFRWANYVETRENVYQGFVDLLLREPHAPLSQPEMGGSDFFSLVRKVKRLYQPAGGIEYQSWQKRHPSPWAEKALVTDGVKFYFWFARFPVVKSVNSRDGTHRVEFMDVRFFFPGIRQPFMYYVEFEDSGKVRSEGFVEGRK